MEVLKDGLSELEIGTSVESFQKFVDSQSDLFHSQIDQLQKIVVKQCKLTGVNPLSQEMAAGALSINIGKRPRDLLNPKAVKYMQSVFSIKDAISKKESREISALFGVTLKQVREFFTSQRSRVRRLVRLSSEKAIRSNACKEPNDGIPASSDPMIPINPVPLNSVVPSIEEPPSCSMQDEALSNLDDLDKQFVDNVFSLMRKEESFSGQEEIMEWILQIQNSSVLCWFLTKGGVMILATWLSQAAVEEQTNVLLLILKVLCHLPLHKSLPVHLSAILQSVNRLRFYRTSDISNRARVLLSRWSKLLARNQAIKKPNGMKPSSNAQNEINLTQSISEIMEAELWHPNTDVPEDVLGPSYENSDDFRKLEGPQAVKLLPAPSDDSNKKPILGVSSSQTRERRKVQLVEQPGQMTVSKSPQTTRAVPVNQSRPMSADDIQKAKMRAMFMQSKYGKSGLSKESAEAKAENLLKPSNKASIPASSKVSVQPKIEENKNSMLLPSKISNRQEPSFDSNLGTDSKESLWEKSKRVQILWKTPAEIKLNDVWRVGAGEHSKEVDVQKNRNCREKETSYQTIQEIPSNPKEPWDLEMDYDDTLTPEISIEQLPDADGAEMLATSNQGVKDAVPLAATSSQNCDATSTAEPDLELLAVLLKNPELVFALTSGEAGSLSTEDTVKLLDMIKKGSVNLAGNVNGIGGKVENVEVSLPSPTPPSDSGTSGWREAMKNPFSRQSSMPNRVSHSTPVVATTNLVLPQIPATSITPQQQPTNLAVPLSSQPLVAAISQYSLPQETSIVSENRPSALHSVHQSRLTSSPIIQNSSSDIVLTTKKNLIATNNGFSLNSLAVASTLQVDSMNTINPLHNYVTLREPERLPNSLRQTSFLPSGPSATYAATQQQAHPHVLQQPLLAEPSLLPPVYASRPQTVKLGPTSDSWRARQGFSSNHHPQPNQINYNALIGGQMQTDPSWERSDYVRRGYESWSPEHSPVRNPDYTSVRNFPESRNNPGEYYRPPRNQNSSGYWDHSRQGYRKWHDRRL
ncbi:Homeobox protein LUMINIDEPENDENS [Quillaja saponaria]|uniref:Homeobox protein LUMINIDEPENDENS n=1 Tax=Quillaja saponaria TaxID=32244 RepID=A0AAD7VEH8_QUISA|nr:Homeobox protein LUMINIDEPENDENS [Quillaja saponaria]